MYVRVQQDGLWLSFSLINSLFFDVQGEELISAASNGDQAAVKRLLKENPSLIRYKDSVRRIEYYFLHLTHTTKIHAYIYA